MDGTVVYGLAARGPLSNDVHGEHSVLTNARIKDKNINNFRSLVCVTLNLKFKSPCGNCRELLKHQCPNIDIIVSDPDTKPTGKLVKIKSKYLLPYPYQSGETREESKLDIGIDVVKR
jgi:cytidine deaminase